MAKKKIDKSVMAQQIMPLAGVQGSLIRLKDGRTNIAVWVEGTNDSLFTYGQKLEEAQSLAACLRATTWPTTILKVPKAIDANANLVHIDAQIADLKENIFSAPDGPHRRALETRLDLLQGRYRKRAEAEALSGDRIIFPTYLIFQFPAEISDDVALRDARIFVSQIIDTGRKAHICDFSEIVEMMQLFFTAHTIDVDAANGRQPIFAVEREG